MIKVLVTNDDGIEAEGIKRLVGALQGKADVYVCAPDGQRSASGHGITIGKPMYVNEVEFEGAVKATKCSGTPVDCVKLGIKYYGKKGIKFDLVYSGINHGGNLGTDTLYSGTVSAAVEGALSGIPSVSLSLNSHNPKEFDFITELIKSTFDKIKNELKPGMVLNMNSPHLPKEEIKGTRITKLGKREYEEWLEPCDEEEGETSVFEYGGRPKVYGSKNLDYDVLAMQEGYASITPLQFDLTAHEIVEEIWERGIKELKK